MFLTIASKSKIKYLDEVTGVYRIFPGESATRSKDPKEKYNGFRELKKGNLLLIDYLGIDCKAYKIKLRKDIVKANIINALFKIPLFISIYKYIYDSFLNKKDSGSGYY